MIDINYIQKKYKFNFKNSLGQNFLNNSHVLDSIIEKGEFNNNDVILEIGPGFGVLTCRLLSKAYKVIAVELDKELVNILKDEFKNFNNLEIVHKDFLKLDLEFLNEYLQDKTLKVIGNIPYYITTPILTRLFESSLNIDSIILMVQKEVGERILANPSTKEYGSLTIFANYYSKVSIIKEVSSFDFIPRPKVDSVVIKFDILKNRLFTDKNDEKKFLGFVKQCFNMRRKTLFNVLQQFVKNKEILENISNEINIDFKKRGETLSILEFKNIFDSIGKLNL